MNLEIFEQRNGGIKKIDHIVIRETPLYDFLQSIIPEKNKVFYIHDPSYSLFTEKKREEVISAAFDSYDLAILVNKIAGTLKEVKEDGIIDRTPPPKEIKELYGKHIKQIYAEAINSNSMKKLLENSYPTENFILPNGANGIKRKIIELN